MAELLEKTVIAPNLTETLEILKQDIFATLNCVRIGKIVSFDPAKRTAQVQMLFKRILPDGTTLSTKPLIDVPVFTLQGGGGYLQFPIAPGDQCLLLFSDRNIDAWFSSGTEAVPFDQRCHDFSDGIALVGLNALTSTQPPYLPNQATFAYQGSSITLLPGSIVLSHGGGAVTVEDGALTMTDTGGGQLQVNGGLIKIGNSATTLLTLLDGLIDVIKAATVQDGPSVLPLTTTTIAALTAYKSQLAVLLQ